MEPHMCQKSRFYFQLGVAVYLLNFNELRVAKEINLSLTTGGNEWFSPF